MAVRVLDDDGHEVVSGTTSIEVAAGEVVATSVDLTIASPRRWDGRRDPHRYTAEATVTGRAAGTGEGTNATTTDTATLPFGLRTMTVDAETGFHLNGRPYPLRGVSRHDDVNGTPAVSVADIAADLDLIDEIGVTAVRLAHYQHATDVLDGCDERGIVVWAEVPVNSKVSTTDPLTNAESQLVELIRQQRHHPSIACWGVQNEAIHGRLNAVPKPAP